MCLKPTESTILITKREWTGRTYMIHVPFCEECKNKNRASDLPTMRKLIVAVLGGVALGGYIGGTIRFTLGSVLVGAVVGGCIIFVLLIALVSLSLQVDEPAEIVFPFGLATVRFKNPEYQALYEKYGFWKELLARKAA